MRKELEQIEIRGEHEARVRTWETLAAAFAEREPVRPPRRSLRPLLALAAAAALVAAALSPPGLALIERVREAIGVEGAAPALFSLPAEGRLLVESDAGAWVVRPDGSKRLLGGYREASWSPNGLFVAATRPNALYALEPGGDVRWSLARPDVRQPRWAGLRGDTRIAYLSGSDLRVVAGDGTGDRLLARSVSPAAPAWRPGEGHVLAYADGEGRVRVVDTESDESSGGGSVGEPVLELAWLPGGETLLALTPAAVRRFDESGRLLRSEPAPAGTRNVAAAVGPRGGVAIVRRRGSRSEVVVGGQVAFFGAGVFTDVVWSPDGRWLLVAWADADQWVFVRSAGVPEIDAVSAIARQFEGSFPAIAGWCCTVGDAGAAAVVAPPAPRASAAPPAIPEIEWRPSAAVGLPWVGRLVRGVLVPAEGPTFFTWDPIERRSPNREWRRVGTDRLVRLVLGVLDDFVSAHPDAPRIGIGDLSRPGGGDFGPRYGRPGHVSHQNGLDADVYYPRLDRSQQPPRRPAEVDRALAQDLVDRFVAAGASKVFVGPNIGLSGPPGVVQEIPNHDNHLHVRIDRE